MKCNHEDCDKNAFGKCEECGKEYCADHLIDFGRICEQHKNEAA